jgi:hypothetical protein
LSRFFSGSALADTVPKSGPYGQIGNNPNENAVQIGVRTPDRRFTEPRVAAVLTRFPARSPEIEIQNNSTVNLTAFAVSIDPVAQADTSTGPFIIFVDAAIEPQSSAR